MKEKDLERNLDNLIIDGLIKEAEQDNADFEAAMRTMSDDEFTRAISDLSGLDIEGSQAGYYAQASGAHETLPSPLEKRYVIVRQWRKWRQERQEQPEPSRWRIIRPWIASAVAAAAVVLAVVIPVVSTTNAKLCDSALYASADYMTPSKGGYDLAGASTDNLRKSLPALERRYAEAVDDDDVRTAGWDLTIAYLRLHKKGDAVRVLEELSVRFGATPFGLHCQELLKQL